MKYYFLSSIFFISIFSCCQQQQISTSGNDQSKPEEKNMIEDANGQKGLINAAYFTVTVPGAQQVDENGNAVDNFIVSRSLIVEHKGTDAFTAVTARTPDGLLYKGTASLLPKEGLTIGEKNNTDEKVFLKPKAGNSLWMISLEPVGFTKQSTEPLQYLEVKATTGNAPFKITIKGETQLKGVLLY